MSSMTLQSAVTTLDFSTVPETAQLRDLAQRFLADHAPATHTRQTMATDMGYDPAVWHKLATETGLTGLLVPVEFGGVGLGLAAAQIVLEQMGMVLFPGPYLASAVISVQALTMGATPESQSNLLPAIADGSAITTLAFESPGQTMFDPADMACDATCRNGKWKLNGRKSTVLHGHIADCILVLANTPDGPALFSVTADASGLGRRKLPTFDLTRNLAEITFSETPADLISSIPLTRELTDRLQQTIIAALAAEQLGGAQACLDMAVAYAAERVQFGRVIGSYQAIKHKCADMLLAVETARSAVQYAGACETQMASEFPIAALMARSACSDAYLQAAEDNLQIHGGIGFTWEHDCHLYLKRAKSSGTMFGTPAAHRQQLSDLLAI